MDVIYAAKEIFPLLNIITNGVVPIPLDINARIYVSLDGKEQTHNAIRNAPVFYKILNNYRNDHRVIFLYTISQANYLDIAPTIAKAKETGVAGITFQLFHPAAGINKQQQLSGSASEIAYQTLLRYSNDPFVLITPAILNSLFRQQLSEERCLIKRYLRCFSANGTLKRCCNAECACPDCKLILPHVHETLNHYPDHKTWQTFLKLI